MTSLRARKKRATEQALANAAYSLALGRGVESVTTDDIASQAGVSRRTFANYYPNKHAAVVDGFVHHLGIPIWRPDQAVDLASIPSTFDELIDNTRQFITTIFTDPRRIEHIQHFAVMMKDNPALEPHIHSVFLEFQESTSHEVLAERFGDPKVSIFIGAVVGSLGGIIRLILGPLAFPHDAADPGAPPTLTDQDIATVLTHIDLTFIYLRNGFVDDEKETPRA